MPNRSAHKTNWQRHRTHFPEEKMATDSWAQHRIRPINVRATAHVTAKPNYKSVHRLQGAAMTLPFVTKGDEQESSRPH
jgi:hypothetical protein